MRATRRGSEIQSTSGQKAKGRKPTSKELDLLLLAGCSCLLTVLYHPVAEALQTHGMGTGSSAISTQASNAPMNSMNAFHMVLPPAREDGKEEEEA